MTTMENWNPERITDLLQRFNLPKKTLQEALGISRTHLYYLEKGVKQPSKTLELLLDAVEEKLAKKEKGRRGKHGKGSL